MSAYPTPAPLRSRRARLLAGCALAAAAATPGHAQFQANGVVVGGDAAAVISSSSSLVTVRQGEVVINWTPTDTATSSAPINILPAGNVLRFDTELDGLSNYTVLNRVIPTDQSRAIQFNGTVQSSVSPNSVARQGGNIWFYSPGGIIAGAGSRFDVGSLILTTNDIDTTGGLFGANGEIRFRGAADSRSRVQIDFGSKIDARAELSSSNYVALVAPRVTQNGFVNADGSVALIAATALDLTIPVNGGLFDIAVTAGTKVNAGGETILTHAGETYANDVLETGAARRVYMAAVSKNDAVTLLVSGKAGYDAAQGVQVGNGGLELVAGRSVAILDASGLDRQVTTGAGDAVQLGAATFNQAVRAQAAEFRLSLANGQSLSLTDGLEVIGDRIAISTSGGSTTMVGGAVNLTGKSIEMAIGGEFSIGSSLSASAKAFDSSPSLLTGGSIDITVNGGKLTSTFGLNLNAGANNSGGGDAQGGDVFLRASNGGFIDTGYGITLDASARTEGGLGAAGRATGGSLLVSVDGGIISADTLSLAALGLADAGSSGLGGVIDVQARSSGQISLGSLEANARAASGEAGYGDVGGDATGGRITLDASGTSKIVSSGGISLSAVAFGDDQSATDAFGGSAMGGAIALLTADTAEIATSGSLAINASAFGGEAGYGSGGGAMGGTVELTSTGGAVRAGEIIVSAAGEGADGGNGGGGGTGGRIDIVLNGGTVATASLALDASGLGGDAGSGSDAQGGAGLGGFVTLDSRAGSTLTFDQLSATSSGAGGADRFFFSQNAFGGFGQGGEIAIKLAGTTAAGKNEVSLAAFGTGGSGNSSGGTGKGGTLELTVSGGTGLSTLADVQLVAKAFGGNSLVDAGGAEGGAIAIRADGGSLTAFNLDADASGDGGSSFSSGAAGNGIGGTILLESRAGGLITGASDFVANGTGGDANPPFSAGLGKGGAIAVRISGGTIDATGGTMRLDAIGTGGLGAPILALVGGPVLADGGTVDVDVDNGGQFLLTSLFATANAQYNDTDDGFAFENHGANAVGGTIRLALGSGKITADGIALEANGTGANSQSGGEGGTGYQGRAEILVTGGEFEVPSLDVIARAFGGRGINQSGEGDREAGSGGGAGLGTSPYGAGAGAYIGVTGGTFRATSINLVAESTGGLGGDGDEFAGDPRPGAGGSAIGAPAAFTISGTGSADVSSLSIVTTGRGGTGGSLLLNEFSGSDAVAGFGGDGTGGSTSVTIGGTGTTRFSFIQAQADGRGGDGGLLCTFLCGATFGDGRGGDGGAGFGGGANLTFNSSLEPSFAVIEANAQGVGGLSGEGPRGGDGGSAIGGSATIAFAGGTHDVFTVRAVASGLGTQGAIGLGGNGGRGGSGGGGNANLTIGDGAVVAIRDMSIRAESRGGRGGDGADDVSAAFGGAGGSANGGFAALNVLSGSLTLFGSGEGFSTVIDASASGGNGGSGGDASEGIVGNGGNGGNAVAGTARLLTQDASTDINDLSLIADATGGGRGFAGLGLDGSDGDRGDAVAGLAELSLTQNGASTKVVNLGFVTATADASAAFEDFAVGTAGRVVVSASGGTTKFSSLRIASIGSSANGDGIALSGNNALLQVAGTADLQTTGRIVADLGSNSSFEAGSSLFVTADGDIDLLSGDFAGNSVTINAGLGVSSGGTIASANDLSVQAGGGTADLGTLVAGAGVFVTATKSIQLVNASGTDVQLVAGGDGSFGHDVDLLGQIDASDQINIQATRDIRLTGADVRGGGGVFLSARDDIIIGEGSLLRSDSGPPPEFGYGGPLLLVRAGLGELPPGEVGSIILDGGIEFGNGTVTLQGAAIAGNRATSSVQAGNFYADLTDIPPNEVALLDDFGQLSGQCLQGSICLGAVQVSRVLEIGDGFSAPILLRLNPQTDAISVFLRGQSVELGQTGVATSLKGSQNLQVEASNGNLALLGALDIVGGTDLARLTSTNDILGAANVSAPGTLDLFAGDDISLGRVAAQTIRTVGLDEVVVENSGINAAGKVEIGKLTYAQDARVVGGKGVSIGEADLGSNRLELFTKAGLARLGGGTLLDLNAVGESVDVGVAAGGDVFATATNGTATLGTISANLIDAAGSQGISFADLNATGLIRLDSPGAISGGSATGGTISVLTPGKLIATSLATTAGALDVDAGSGIELATVAAQGAANFKAVTGAVSVTADAAVSGAFSVQGTSVSLTGANGLKVATVTATDGNLELTATQGSLFAEQASASRTATIIGTGGVTIGSLTSSGASLTAKDGGILVSSITGPVDALAKSVSLAGAALTVGSAQATGGDLLLRATSGDLSVGGTGPVSATGAVALQADVGALQVSGIRNSGSGITASGTSISLGGDTLLIKAATASSGTLALNATTGGITAAKLSSSGAVTLSALAGVLVSEDLIAGAEVTATGKSVSLTSATGLSIASATATGGDLILKTVTGDLVAGKSTAAGAISLDSAGALGFSSLAAQQGVSLKAAGNVTGGAVSGTTVAVSAGGSKGIALQSIGASDSVTLGAVEGSIQIGNVLTGAAIQATGRNIGLASTGNLLLAQATASDGNIALQSSGGSITLGQVAATKVLTADASAGTLTVTGVATAATIGFTSADIAIGQGAQVGSVSQTGAVTLTSTAPRTFVGGTGTGSGYRLDGSELTRVAARDGFTLTTLPTQGSAAFTFVEPDQATIVLDSMTFNGAQLGANGIFTVDAPRSIGIVGNVEYKNFAAGQSVIYRAGSDISLGAETGLVSLKDGAGALAGTLRLQAPQVIAMSVPARREVPDLTLNQARQRLGTNDAVQNDGGYFQAGNIDVRIGRLLFIQNTGANGADVDGLRGFTGNSVRIEATGSSPAQVVLSGRVSTGSGFAVGDELANNITLVGSFDSDSGFGGCTLGATSCGAPPPSVTEVTFSVARDQIQDEQEEDEQEEAIQASQTRPDPVIQFMTAPSSRLDPLIDEPITGAGNEDLWEAPTIPSPGD